MSVELGGAGADRAERSGGWGWVFAAVPLLVVAFHWPAARPGWAFSGSDLRFFFFGLREAVAEALRAGHLPGWQRGFLMGYPLVADPQAALFAPATWLTLPWDAPRALTLATLLHLCIAGWGVAAWMRLRGLRPASGLLAAVLFALGAKQTVHVIHWNFAATTAWWPWMLAGLEGFAARGRGRWLLLSVVATGLCWLGGSPQMALFGSLATGLYALRVAVDLWPRRRGDAAWAVAAVPLGFLLAAVSVLPTVELSGLGPRAGGVDYAFATSWKWPDRWGLALLLLPRAYRDAWGLNLWEATGYVGIPTLALAAAASPRRRGVLLFAALALLGPWLALGDEAPLGLHRLFYDLVPGYRSFRVPTRWLLVSSLAAALLAAEGLEMLRRDPGRWRVGRALLVLAAVGALALLLPRWRGFPFDPAVAAHAARRAVATAAATAVLVLALRRRWHPALAAVAVAALALADQWVHFRDFNETAPASALGPPLRDVAPVVPERPAPRRVAVLAKWGASANAPLRLGWEGALGYGPMSVGRIRDLLEGTWNDAVVRLGPMDRDATFPSARATSPLWPLLGAPLVVSDAPLDLPVLAVGQREWENPLVVHAAPALPRVFWTGSWEVADDRDVTPALLRAARGDRAVLAAPPPGWPPGAASGAPASAGEGLRPDGPVAAERIRVDGGRLSATVVAPRDGLAVILDPFYPGWTATVDGAAAQLLRADYAFQAVVVPAGRHELVLTYRNRWVAVGAAVSLGTLAAVVAALALRRRRGLSAA